MMITVIAAALAASLQPAVCESLASFSIENGAIATAEVVAEGPFTEGAEPIPEHCRVKMTLTPTSDSHINVELWLPSEDWDGRLLAVGNGGFAGRIQGYRVMQQALRRGYATVATDTGHSEADGPGGMFGLGHREKIVDFAYRAVHEMTVKAKTIIQEVYEDPLRYSYFSGCSTGGRQAVMAAQRYPGDFDGIVAGALANRHIWMHAANFARHVQVSRNPEEAVSEELAAMVNDAVMKKCDALGEGFLNNPQQCSFDFESLLCGEGESGDCLTEPQLKTVETYYGGVKTSQGEAVFPGQAMGNLMRPVLPIDENNGVGLAWDTIRIWGFQDEEYDWREFDLDRDLPLIDQSVGWVDAIDPDLRAFQAHGGKLLLFTGWGDESITPKNTRRYYETVLEEMGAGQDDWMRLFMIPGMGHCGGGPGPTSVDLFSVIEQWREHGVAPDEIVGTNPRSGLSRPVCPYPQYAEYDGGGSLADASSWSCVDPSPADAIKQIVADYADARDSREEEAIRALFVDDADQLVSSGVWRRGIEAMVEGMQSSSAANPGDRTLTVETVRFVTEEVAIADARYEISASANRPERKMWSSFLVVKTDDGWRIAAIRNMLPAR